jgi:hypothetical protein
VIVSPIGTMFGSIQYVGVLKDIIFLSYGLVSQAIMLFKCDWLTPPRLDRWGYLTYKWDENHGFLLEILC